VLNDFREGLIEVVFAAFIYHVDDIELKPVRAGRGFSVGDFGLTEGIVGINEVVDDGGPRDQLAQQLQSFPRDRRGEKARSSDVAARPIEANKARPASSALCRAHRCGPSC
jgi:hypothetical protein